MATRKKTNKKPGRAGKIILAALAALLVLLMATLGVGAVNAATIHVRRAEVKLNDLPPAFDGVTLLYASDIDLCGLNTAGRAADLFARLQSLQPDVLLLGGDYTSNSLLDILNRGGQSDASDPAQLRQRAEFIQSLSNFQAPMGKFAIRTADEPDPEALALALTDAGIQPLFDGSATLRSGSETLMLAGFTGDTQAIAGAAAAARKEDCIVALCASPSAIPQIMINEVSGGGAWCDMILTGHTHGGQVRLFGATALALNTIERTYLEGWRVESGIPILTTSGVGCEGMNVRLGSRAEVWLITLRRADGVVLPDLS